MMMSMMMMMMMMMKTNEHMTYITLTDKIWYMGKGHPQVWCAPIGVALTAPWTQSVNQ